LEFLIVSDKKITNVYHEQYKEHFISHESGDEMPFVKKTGNISIL
jgi:hypothetical protein